MGGGIGYRFGHGECRDIQVSVLAIKQADGQQHEQARERIHGHDLEAGFLRLLKPYPEANQAGCGDGRDFQEHEEVEHVPCQYKAEDTSY